MRIMILKMIMMMLMSRQSLGGTESEQNVKWEGGERGHLWDLQSRALAKIIENAITDSSFCKWPSGDY